MKSYFVTEEGFDVTVADNLIQTARALYSEWGRLDTFDTYERLLCDLRLHPSIDLVPLRRLCDGDAQERLRVAIRFDIDVDPFAALELARIGARYGAPSTFYVLHTASYYLQNVEFAGGTHEFRRNPWLRGWFDAMAVAGPEFGLHIDPLQFGTTYGVDGIAALRSELEFVRSLGITVETVTAHNSAPAYGAENFEVFSDYAVRGAPTPKAAGLPLGRLSLAELGLKCDGNYPVARADYDDAKFSAWVAGYPEHPIENEVWMRTNILDNPGFAHAYDYELWHLGPDRWVIGGKSGPNRSVWLWMISYGEMRRWLAHLPLGAKLVFVLHPEYFGGSLLPIANQMSCGEALPIPVIEEAALERLHRASCVEKEEKMQSSSQNEHADCEPTTNGKLLDQAEWNETRQTVELRALEELERARKEFSTQNDRLQALQSELAALRSVTGHQHADIAELGGLIRESGLTSADLRFLHRVLKLVRSLLFPFYFVAHGLARGTRYVLRPLNPLKRAVGALVGRISRLIGRIAGRVGRVRRRASAAAVKAVRLGRVLLSGMLRSRRRPLPGGHRILMLTTSQLAIDPRIPKVALTLAAAGYEVDVMAYSTDLEQQAPMVTQTVAPGLQYLWVTHADVHDPIWRIYQREFVWNGIERVYDVVHANDLTTLLTAWFMARKKGRMLVYDAHEMWAENVVFRDGQYVPIAGWRQRLANLAERVLVRNVDLFTSVSDAICEEYKRRFKLPTAPFLLPNYPRKTDILESTADAKSVPALIWGGHENSNKPADAFLTIYLGGVNPLRNIETVIRAHGLLPPNFHFVIRGPAIEYYEAQYRTLAEACGAAGRVHILPGVPQEQLMNGAKGCDCGIVMLKNYCKNFYWFYPNKFFEYMFMKLPVACSDFPVVAAHLEREKCGVTFDPDHPESIAEALMRLAADREEARAMGMRGYESAMEKYCWEAVASTYVDAYEAARLGRQ